MLRVRPAITFRNAETRPRAESSESGGGGNGSGGGDGGGSGCGDGGGSGCSLGGDAGGGASSAGADALPVPLTAQTLPRRGKTRAQRDPATHGE